MKRNSDIERARTAIKCLLAFAGLVCVAALIAGDSVPGLGGTALLIAAVCVVLIVLVLAAWMRCPFCGKVIVVNCLAAKTCPHCGRNLVNGKKEKGKNRK